MMMQLFMLGINNRRATATLLLVLTVVAGAGLPRLTIDTGVDSLIPENDPGRLVYQRVMGEFGTDNKTIIYIKDPQLWTPGKLATLEQLHRSIEKIEKVTRVESVFSLHTIDGREGKVDSMPLLREAPQTDEQALQARESALDNPLYMGNFFSDDGSATAIIVSVVDIDEEENFNRKFFERLEELLVEVRGEFEKIVQVGSPRINAELRASLYEDFVLLGPQSALILVLSILFFLRSTLSAVIPVVTSALTIIWTFGMLGWFGIPLNILSAMIPSLIIVIGSTEDTHMMSAFFRGLDEADSDRREYAIRYMASHIGLPLMLTVLTTAMGFASNVFSSIELIRHFAIASTFAMLVNGVITILLVPILLSVYGSTGVAETAAGAEAVSLPDRVIKVFRVSQDRYPTATLTITGILCAFFIYQASTLYVTNDPLSYFPSDRPLIVDTRQIHEDLAGIKIFFITLESKTAKAFQEPRNLRKLVEIQRFLDKQGGFDRSISLADHLAFVNREFRGEFAEMTLPDTREMVAQYLLFFHRSDLDSYVSHDYRRANIIVRHNITDSHTLNGYISELEDVVRHLAGPGIAVHLVGENLMVNNAAESLMLAQVKALGILLGLIFLIMSAMFTSFKGGAIALVPAVIPISLMFGIMGLLDIPLNPGTAMVAVIAIGIAVDGTIHLLARYNELCRRTSDYVAAVHEAVQEEATPLIVSSLALALGFGILLFSNFTIVAQFGALAAATMLFSIFANLLITPIIMTRIRLVGLYQILAMSVDREVLDRSPLFNSMTNYQRRKAILISEINEFEDGELLVEQDTVGRSMYLILSGEAEVVRRDGSTSNTLATLQPGQVFGEIGYIRETQRTADVRAVGQLSALRFDYERMEQDLKFFPNIVAKLNFNIGCILGERLADMVEQSSND